MRKERLSFTPDYAVPPGVTLEETMESLGMTQKELAARTGLTAQSLNRIFKGDQPITCETANRLELVTGVPATFWNSLEANYREQLARLEERKSLSLDLDWLKTMPVRELQKRGVIGAVKDKVEVLRQMLAFFSVGSVDAWHAIWEAPEVSARRSNCFDAKLPAAAAWIRLGERQAQAMACAPYSRERFLEALTTVRGLTREAPEKGIPDMLSLCAAAGVAVALVREFPGVPWNGATRWLTPEKPMILLCLRGKGEDHFWFSFFHEAGHVLHGSKKRLFVNDGQDGDDQEKEADAFAAEFLIPASWNGQIARIRSYAEVTALARTIGVSPGIIVGRFHHLTRKWKLFRTMIRTFAWKAE